MALETLSLIGKIIFLFLFTLLCFRLMGYRSIGDMEPLDYVIVLGIGEIMGSPLSGRDLSVWQAVVAIATLTALQVILSKIYNWSPKLAQTMEGGPIPVIRDGEIIHTNLAKHRLSVSDIMEELRIKGLRDERDVDLANLEPSGRMSVILKNEASPVTPRYLDMETSYILVSNGNVNPSEWERGQIKVDDVVNFLEAQHISNWREVSQLIYKNGQFHLKSKEE